MKICFITLRNKTEPWVEDAGLVYVKKLKTLINFDLELVKAKSIDRAGADRKRQEECQTILNKVDPGDRVLLFDEGGKQHKDSETFSSFLVSELERGHRRLVFVVAGAFGASDELKARADVSLSLSNLTMNHLVAQTVALEQIYRGLSIWKGLPYHNR